MGDAEGEEEGEGGGRRVVRVMGRRWGGAGHGESESIRDGREWMVDGSDKWDWKDGGMDIGGRCSAGNKEWNSAFAYNPSV